MSSKKILAAIASFFLLLNAQAFATPCENDEQNMTPESLKATQEFLSLILREARVLKRSGATSIASIPAAYERTAEGIENWEFANNKEGLIAEEVVDWGYEVANRLRSVALLWRDIGMQAARAGDNVEYRTSWQTWGWYWSFMTRQFRTNPTRRIATYDAAKFRWEQYNEVRSKTVELRRKYRTFQNQN